MQRSPSTGCIAGLVERIKFCVASLLVCDLGICSKASACYLLFMCSGLFSLSLL